eukprot:4145102-Amphidinium_carterae.2
MVVPQGLVSTAASAVWMNAAAAGAERQTCSFPWQKNTWRMNSQVMRSRPQRMPCRCSTNSMTAGASRIACV